MDAILYAEIYCICIIITCILFFWNRRNGMQSFAELCLSRLLACFIINFSANFLFTLFDRILDLENTLALSYAFKTLYHITLIIGVFIWCVYADAQIKGAHPDSKKRFSMLMLPAAVPIALAFISLSTHKLFIIDASSHYIRGPWFQFEMFYLLVFSVLAAVRLLRYCRTESEPLARSHQAITATFPLCVMASWALSFVGEAFPVICVAVMVELLLLFLGTMMQQISIDNLTQVNNRQNLLGFMNYKLKYHERDVYLMMMDLDSFKYINDNYGHVEGDNALVHASAAIKTACGKYIPRPYIARYGGDEFIVVIETDNPKDVEIITESIHKALTGYDETSPYRLRMSIGTAKLIDGQTPKELIHEADKMLYDIKKKRKTEDEEPPRNANGTEEKEGY
jgi:diguanylate cyclase (GGDEF) domain